MGETHMEWEDSLRVVARVQWATRIGVVLFGTLILAPFGWMLLAWWNGNTAVGIFLVLNLLVLAGLIFIPWGRRKPVDLPPPVLKEPTSMWEQEVSRATDAYGPEGTSVARFLARLPALTPDHWRVVVAPFSAEGNSIWAGLRAHVRAYTASATVLTVPEARTREPYTRAIGHTLERAREQGAIPFPATHSGFGAALAACHALLFRDVLSPKQFAALYAPFEPVIPAASLERG